MILLLIDKIFGLKLYQISPPGKSRNTIYKLLLEIRTLDSKTVRLKPTEPLSTIETNIEMI